MQWKKYGAVHVPANWAKVSINDHPAIRECFAGFDMEALKLDYTVGGGANRVERGELVIYSWDREAEPAGLF